MHPYDQLVRRPFQPHAMMLRIRPEIIRFQKTPCFKPESLPPSKKGLVPIHQYRRNVD